jgi:hypothetical protein
LERAPGGAGARRTSGRGIEAKDLIDVECRKIERSRKGT